MSTYDVAIKDGLVIIPGAGAVTLDIGIRDGRISCLSDEIPASEAESVINASGRAVFPGAIDSHFHVGIYRPLARDAQSESAAAVTGGVTTIINYFRTGSHYLSKTGPYQAIFPEVLGLSHQDFITDYAYHLAIMTSEQLMGLKCWSKSLASVRSSTTCSTRTWIWLGPVYVTAST
ncbi:MAG: hypothetical protein QXI60_00845 [Thermofilaceae archaeon]